MTHIHRITMHHENLL